MRTVAVLETMWDWEARTSSAGYTDEAPGHFRINGDNFTGRRLYWFLGHYDLLVTNACKELVPGPNHHGRPNPTWLRTNLEELLAMTEAATLLLICGSVAQKTYEATGREPWADRVVYLPHPAARNWTRSALDTAQRIIQEWTTNVHLTISPGGKLKSRRLESESRLGLSYPSDYPTTPLNPPSVSPPNVVKMTGGTWLPLGSD